jgi:DNA-binding XRE family transcriptional regulator
MTRDEKHGAIVFASLPGSASDGYNGHAMPLGMTLGKVFRHHRELKGRIWTQRHLAKQAGLHLSTIVKIENDDPSVGLETKTRVATVLGTTLDRLTADVTHTPHGVGNPSDPVLVRYALRTRLPQAIPPLDQPDSLGEKESGSMRDGPQLETLSAYWLHLSADQRAALIDVAESMYHRAHRDRVGKAGG